MHPFILSKGCQYLAMFASIDNPKSTGGIPSGWYQFTTFKTLQKKIVIFTFNHVIVVSLLDSTNRFHILLILKNLTLRLGAIHLLLVPTNLWSSTHDKENVKFTVNMISHWQCHDKKSWPRRARYNFHENFKHVPFTSNGLQTSTFVTNISNLPLYSCVHFLRLLHV